MALTTKSIDSPSSALEAVHCAQRNVGEARYRVAALADRLLGGGPAYATTDACCESRPGELGRAWDAADATMELARDIISIVCRIESSLPPEMAGERGNLVAGRIG